MTNPLKDPRKNPIKGFYEEFGVPILGRALRVFSTLIEGKPPKEKQTYNLRDKEVH